MEEKKAAIAEVSSRVDYWGRFVGCHLKRWVIMKLTIRNDKNLSSSAANVILAMPHDLNLLVTLPDITWTHAFCC